MKREVQKESEIDKADKKGFSDIIGTFIYPFQYTKIQQTIQNQKDLWNVLTNRYNVKEWRNTKIGFTYTEYLYGGHFLYIKEDSLII